MKSKMAHRDHASERDEAGQEVAGSLSVLRISPLACFSLVWLPRGGGGAAEEFCADGHNSQPRRVLLILHSESRQISNLKFESPYAYLP